MTHLAETYNTQFQLGLGDNFYFKGVQNAEDPRFQVRAWLLVVYYLDTFSLTVFVGT